jgi:hypothetical protein
MIEQSKCLKMPGIQMVKQHRDPALMDGTDESAYQERGHAACMLEQADALR